MIYNLIAFLAATSFTNGHVITSGKFEKGISSPDTKVNLGQAQIEVENKLTKGKGKLIKIPCKIKSTIETPEKSEEAANVETPSTLKVPEKSEEAPNVETPSTLKVPEKSEEAANVETPSTLKVPEKSEEATNIETPSTLKVPEKSEETTNVETPSTLKVPEKSEETTNVETPSTLNVPEQVRIQPIKKFLQPVVQTQTQTITDVRTGIPYYLGYATPCYFTGKSHLLALPIQLQADRSEFNVANLKTLPVDNLNLLTPTQIQAINSKFNVANLQTYGRGQRELFTPKYFRYPAKYFPEFYNFPTTTYSPYGIGSNLASPQLNFQVGELANVGQYGKF